MQPLPATDINTISTTTTTTTQLLYTCLLPHSRLHVPVEFQSHSHTCAELLDLRQHINQHRPVGHAAMHISTQYQTVVRHQQLPTCLITSYPAAAMPHTFGHTLSSPATKT